LGLGFGNVQVKNIASLGQVKLRRAWFRGLKKLEFLLAFWYGTKVA
jgi:hypothetical protein